jgi:hypothetical protein
MRDVWIGSPQSTVCRGDVSPGVIALFDRFDDLARCIQTEMTEPLYVTLKRSYDLARP